MKAVEKVVSYIIPIIVLVLLILYFYGGTGALSKLKDNVLDIAPNVSFGKDENIASQPTISQEHSVQINSLKETITKMIASPEGECFAKFDDFSNLGKKGTSMEILYTGDTTEFSVRGGAGGLNHIDDDSFTIENMRPCVIAGFEGNEVIAQNFFDKFIDLKNTDGPYTKPVSSIVFSHKTGDNGFWRSCTNGNALRVPEFEKSPINNQCNNMENEGYLFRTKKDSKDLICFFPTNAVYNADKDGIANEWFSSRKNSLKNRLAAGNFKRCY